jgi:hypothetical protein
MFFLFRSLLVITISVDLATSGLKITIDDNSESAAIPGTLLPVSIDGLKPAPSCSFVAEDGDFTIRLNNQNIQYDLTEAEPNSWYGQEQFDKVDGVGEYAFLRIASDSVVTDTCYLAGTITSRTAGVRIVFKTHADGSTWASVLTADDFDNIVYGEPTSTDMALPIDDLVTQGRQDNAEDVVDMLVLATNTAVCEQAGLEPGCTLNDQTLAPITNLITFLMFQTNQVLRNSDIDLLVRRVGPVTFEQGDFTEEGVDFFVLLEDMIDCNVGNICELREENCADIVHLLSFNQDDRGNLGVASDIGPNPNRWSVITTINNVPLSLLVFTHETGHMLVSDDSIFG